MKATIQWTGGRTVIEGAGLGDSRVADELDRLARAGVSSGVSVWFGDELVTPVHWDAPAELYSPSERS
jgi:hypothetical protein